MKRFGMFNVFAQVPMEKKNHQMASTGYSNQSDVCAWFKEKVPSVL